MRDFMEKWSWLPKLGIWLALIIWAAQGNVAWKSFWDSGMVNRKTMAEIAQEDPKLLMDARIKMDKLSSELYKNAKTSARYGTKEYYADLRKLKLENKRIYHRGLDEVQRAANNLNYLSDCTFQRELRTSKYEDVKEEMWREQQAYAEWLKSADVYKDYNDLKFIENSEPHEKMSSLDLLLMLAVFLLKFLKWFAVFYLRGLLVVPFLYVARMAERGSDIRTMMKEKRFLLAVILWPGLIFRYPFHLVRELRVEAELRRMGNAFRRFTSAERKSVRKIANSADYKAWLAAYGLAGKGRFRRSLLLAIVVTLAVHALSPISARAENPAGRDGPMAGISAVDHDDGSRIDKACNHSDHAERWCIPQSSDDPQLLMSWRGNQITSVLYRKVLCKDIDYIPLCGSQVMAEIIPIT